ncbi:MAG: purine-binding chemotaxis protein CheW [SAR324 cluster bacterium]|nr:purine-binding chemotaxis protein CheW [SAR324 cluster bacterium]
MADELLETPLSSEEEEDTQDGKFLTFPLGDSLYGIEIRYVLEVVIRSSKIQITQVPHMPPYTKGVINLRGKVIPVIDLRTRFQIADREYDDRTCFVVVNIQGMTTGLIVDTVAGVATIATRAIDPPPQLDTSAQSRFIAGMGKTAKTVYILLNVNELLGKDEIKEFQQLESSSAGH